MLVGETQARTPPDGRMRRRRRLWSDEERRRIVAESLEPGASVAAVARRHELNANMLFTWRRQAGVVTDAMALVPATIVAEPKACAPAQAEPTCRIEIVLTGGDRVIVSGDVDAAALTRVIRALSRR